MIIIDFSKSILDIFKFKIDYSVCEFFIEFLRIFNSGNDRKLLWIFNSRNDRKLFFLVLFVSLIRKI